MFRVICYGTFIHNHEVPAAILASTLLKNKKDIHFDLFRDGPERLAVEEATRNLGLNNVHFHGWILKERFPIITSKSHVCLGVFGMTKQSLITIQN